MRYGCPSAKQLYRHILPRHKEDIYLCPYGQTGPRHDGVAHLLSERGNPANILVVDGDAEHQKLVRAVLSREGFSNLLQVAEPLQALQAAETFPPNAIFLDAEAEPVDRIKLLSRLNTRPEVTSFVPILMFVPRGVPYDRKKMIKAGAYDFVSKPAQKEELGVRLRNSLEASQLQRQLLLTDLEIERRVSERTRLLYEAQVEILQRLGRASEYRDDDTGDHTKRVGTLSAKIAQAMSLSEDEVQLIRLAAPLHDIGKIGIRDAVLMKPGKLTESEYTVMRTHAMIGSRILEGNSPLLKMAEIIARTHHERWDGTGYPSRLSGENIPLPGRIVAVADVFDALISARTYKAAWPVEKAVSEIKAQSGRHFDPRVVEAFLSVIEYRPEIAKAA